ncbi:MAG: hypothetical protein IR153_07835 [Flavobacterium sp.]|nr:hypothetical protein [Flavobacterium sp.]
MMWIFTTLLAGIIGGFFNLKIHTEDVAGIADYALYLFFGIVFSSIVPLFLVIFFTGFMHSAADQPSIYLVVFGLCIFTNVVLSLLFNAIVPLVATERETEIQERPH